eukprot:scaffold73841_cov36-Tisochrysis_lutea.AAC.2
MDAGATPRGRGAGLTRLCSPICCRRRARLRCIVSEAVANPELCDRSVPSCERRRAVGAVAAARIGRDARPAPCQSVPSFCQLMTNPSSMRGAWAPGTSRQRNLACEPSARTFSPIKAAVPYAHDPRSGRLCGDARHIALALESTPPFVKYEVSGVAKDLSATA